MEWLIDELIRYLQTLKSKDTVDFWAGVGFLVSPVIAIATFVWYSTRQSAKRHYQVGIDEKNRAVKTAASENKMRLALEEKLAKLEETGPAGFMRRADTEEKQGNDAKLANEARAFLDTWRDPLHRAFLALARKSIADSAEDGAPAFEAARLHATAAYAVDPQNRSTKMLADDLAYGADLAAAGVKVKIKDDSNRETRATAQDQASEQLQKLDNLFYSARNQGRYVLMEEIATQGENLARCRLGPTARWTLIFRRNQGESGLYTGTMEKSATILHEIYPKFSEIFGANSTETLKLQYLLASCLSESGNPQRALSIVEEILPKFSKIGGAENPNTLSTRYLKATCLFALGRPCDSYKAATELLPFHVNIKGEKHHDTQATRSLIANCLQDLGKHQQALDEAKKLQISELSTKDAKNPNTLMTRSLIARCLIDLGRTDDAHASHKDVLKTLRALGLSDESRFVKSALKVELLLAAADTSTPRDA